jgi:hypothetical protein
MARARNEAHIEVIMWMIASRDVSAASSPPWQLAHGGYLGQLEMLSDIHGLFYIPSEELWVDARPGASFYVDGQWQQSSDPLLLVYSRDTWQHLETPEAEGFFPVTWYREQLWGLGSRGFAIRTGNHWQFIAPSPASMPWCFAVDQTGYLWMGTIGQGLWRTANGRYWEHIDALGPNVTIGGLSIGDDHTLWVVKSSPRRQITPVYYWQKGCWGTLPLPSKPKTFYDFCSMVIDDAGQLWLGSSQTGVWRWAQNAWTRFAKVETDTKPGLPPGSVGRLYVDRHQRIWATTYSGVAVYAEEGWIRVFVAPTVPSPEGILYVAADAAYSLKSSYLDHHGRLWLGTTNGHISWIDTEQLLYPRRIGYTLAAYKTKTITARSSDTV